ncbi:siderophore-interacting protein [Streptomyces sp. LP05-1]|uniref:Siderophore-interacting protein n=1 Tax=Streptomyces pyxinae TaxID=2970734 RepID=A0ABT2CFG3_9ACTN|nr:siderophore-interacting protein [Streptomyces sp. LP05-1]MCS0636149.1 siderophore-interacting protein [Streptomyces sp. LP05-1]
MSEQPARKAPAIHQGRVVRTERITPHMVRIVLGGDGLAGFSADEYTDHYVKLLFPLPGVRYPEPFDMDRIREEFPRDQWPANRTYTIRSWDPALREAAIDFVVHGDEGLAGPWAARAQVGEIMYMLGPGGGYSPDPAAGTHLLVGDESALPAIAASLERMDRNATGHAFVEVESAEEEQKIDAPAGIELRWLHRAGRPVGELLIAAVRDLELPAGDVHAFVHGEAGFVKDLRRHLRMEREIPRERLSISGYWRLGQTDEAWRAVKREWNEQVEREQETQAPTA